MRDLFLLKDEQMERLWPFFPKSHGEPRVDDRLVLRHRVRQPQRTALARCPQRLRSTQDAVQPLKTLGRGRCVHAMMEGLAAAGAERRTLMIDATYLKAQRTASSLRVKTYGSPRRQAVCV
jgi:hypothetical protein